MKYFFILLFFIILKTAQSEDYESKLRSELLAKLPKDVYSRPIHTNTNITDVRIFVAIGHIIGLDEKTETFSVNGWVWHGWEDERVKWDRASYGGLSNIRLPQEVIWKPVLLPYNSAQFTNIKSMYSPSQIIATYDGSLRWAPAMTSHTICPMDFHWFPFDEHDCFLELGPWTYSGLEVNITVLAELKEGVVMDYGDVHNEWELVKSYRERYVAHPESPYNWHSVRVHFQVRRRAPYYQLLLILPAVTGIFLCLVVFWTSDNIKPTVIAFNLLHLTMLLAHVYWVIPRNGSAAPAILVLVSNTLAMTGVSLLLSLITYYVSQRTDPPVPEFLQNLLSGWLGLILCLRGTSASVDARLTDSDNVQMEVTSEGKSELKQSSWMILATALDRLFFIVYTFSLFIIIIVAFT